MDCAYELGQHRDVARSAGVSSDEVAAILSETGWRAGPFDAGELAVLALTSELLTSRSVTAETFDRVHRSFGSKACVEVLMVINRYAGLALMLNALDVDLDDSARLPIPARRDVTS